MMATAAATRTKGPAQLVDLYRASVTPVMVDVPRVNVLCIDGVGAPEDATTFQAAIGALYSLAYTIKFARKKAGLDSNYHLLPLEGLWSGAGTDFLTTPRAQWRWTLLMVQPPVITAADVAHAVQELERKGKCTDQVRSVRFEPFAEGRAAQVMHIGPYSAERATIDRLRGFIAEQGLHPAGRHHEIYLGDPRRADPAKLRTILRQPVANGRA